MEYNAIVNEKLEELYKKDEPIVLAIESSCDETAASIIKGYNILSNIVSSQIDIHKLFGGVVPEIASRNHATSIQLVVEQAFKQAELELKDIDAIAVTYGAGLQGALLVGVSFAKALSYASNKPLIPVNHIRGHIAVNYLINKDIEFPYLCLMASGGNTAIIYVKNPVDFEILGQTQDDACGECFDKVARVLGLKYPGGPQIEKLAGDKKGDILFPSPAFSKDNANFSFSGLKTAVVNYVHKKEQKNETIDRENIASSFQETAFMGIVENLTKCYNIYNVKNIVLAGGVASNSKLRYLIKEAFKEHDVDIFYPPVKYCTDNAVMIAAEAMTLIKSKEAKAAKLDLDVKSSVLLNETGQNYEKD